MDKPFNVIFIKQFLKYLPLSRRMINDNLAEGINIIHTLKWKNLLM